MSVVFSGFCAVTIVFLYFYIFSDVVADKSTSWKTQKRKYVMEKILPNKTFCGQQHYDDYFHQENEIKSLKANVYEFPWMVSLINGDYRCSGFLISYQYFITTEDCFRRGYQDTDKPSVSVGVHNIYKKISCNPFSNGDDCTNGITKLDMEKSFKINSIVLVKFKKGVSYSFFVRPICLPFKDNERPTTDDMVMISGWGRLPDTKYYVSIKKKHRQKIISVNDDKCKSEDVIDTKNLICTLPVQNSTTACWGDSGSPTMYMYEDNWFAAGVTTAGSTCTVNHPVVSIAITPEIVNLVLDVIYDDTVVKDNTKQS